jgi:hypothetical protein
MDLVLEMAQNYSEKMLAGSENGGSGEEFDGRFEPLVVSGSIAGALENVCEQADGEGGKESLEGLKKALNK